MVSAGHGVGGCGRQKVDVGFHRSLAGKRCGRGGSRTQSQQEPLPRLGRLALPGHPWPVAPWHEKEEAAFPVGVNVNELFPG